jgi:hypothetical protein
MGRVESMTTPSRDLYGIFFLFRCAEQGFTSRSEKALCVLGCLKDGGAIERMKDVITEPPDHQHSGQFRRARRKKTDTSGVLRLLGYQFELIRHSA